MAVQRFLPDVERTRRAAGFVCLAIGALGDAGLVWGVAATGRVTVTTVVFFVFATALAAGGVHLAFRPAVVLEVDPDARTYVVVRSGKRSGSGPLEELGPLAVSRRTREVGSTEKRRTVVEYVVGASHSKIDLHVMSTAGKARQKMEALGHAWRLPCRSLGGVVRAAGDLDAPLHRRLRNDGEAKAAAPLRPEWGLRIEPVFRGQSIVSTHRSWAPLTQGALLALAPVVIVALTSSAGLLSTLREASGDLLDRVFLGLIGVVALALLWQLWKGARDTFFPGVVGVTENGVSYRGRRMAFDEIEEVIAGVPIEIVGDRRILSLAVSYCPREAVGPAAHEIQRLILEVAPQSTLPR